MVGAENGGFLRRVGSVKTEGSQVTLGTEQASLVEAVERGEASTSFDLSDAQREKGKGRAPDDLEWKAIRTAKGVEPKENTLGIELTNAEITDGDQAAMEIVFKNGEAEYDPSVDFDLEIADEEVDRLSIATSGTANFSTDVEVMATNTIEAGNKKSLARFRTSPIVFFIGPVPVTIQPVVDFFAGYKAQIQQTGSIQTGIESSNTVTLGAEYANSSWSPITEREKSIDPRPFDWNVELSGEAKGYVRPELTLKVYQAAGPLINTGPYVRADASVRSDSWEWGLYGGLDASFGGKVEIFSFELARYDHTFSLAEAEIATDSGDRADEGIINGGAITP